MLSLLLVALSSLGAAPLPALAAEPAPLALGVYYEALCGDCRDFVVDQLNVTYSQVPEILDVTLVPWGKAKAGADGVITCQHGAEECWGNRLHACVSAAASSKAVRVGVVSCLMEKLRSLHTDGPACVAAAGLSWDEQTSCADSEDSYQQVLLNGELTAALDPSVTFVPTVTLDGSQGSGVQQLRLVYDLLAAVCAEWQARGGETPAGCL